MKTELVDVSPVHKEIKIEVEPDEIRPVYQKVVQQYARMATLPGFRKGHAPSDLIKTRYREDINNDVLRELLPQRVQNAIAENNLQPLSEPQLHVDNVEKIKLNGSESVSLHVHVEVMPTIETVNYNGLEAVRRVRPVTDEEIEKAIQERRQEQASFAPVEDRAAELGDVVTVDIDGKFVDDETAEPIHVEDLQIELGSAGVQQEFTETLIGVSPDETKIFNVEYPADFSSAGLAGKTLEYTATVKSLGKVELPELNDEFAASLSDDEATYATVQDLQTKTRELLEGYAKIESDNRLRDELVNKLIDANDVDVPPTLVNYQAQGLTQQFAQNMEQQGVDMRNADQKLWQMLYQRMLPQATREVRGALLLEKIAQLEAVEIGEEEITQELESLAKYSGRTTEEVKKLLSEQENGESEMRGRLHNRKAIEILVSTAQITDGEWQEEQPEMELPAEETDEQTTEESATVETENSPAEPEADQAVAEEDNTSETANA